EVQSAYRSMMRSSSGDSLLQAIAARSGSDMVALAALLATPIGATGSAGTNDDLASQSLEAVPGALAQSLSMVGRLIRTGLSTKVYPVSMGSFDTHPAQADTHPALLAQLDGAVPGFFRPLVGHPKRNGVVLA